MWVGRNPPLTDDPPGALRTSSVSLAIPLSRLADMMDDVYAEVMKKNEVYDMRVGKRWCDVM